MIAMFDQENPLSLAILIYILFVFTIIYTKPNFLYNDQGKLKLYGNNDENKTILPLPVLFIVAPVFIYLFTYLL